MIDQQDLQKALAKTEDRKQAQLGAVFFGFVAVGIVMWLAPDWLWAKGEDKTWNWIVILAVFFGSVGGMWKMIDKQTVEKKD